MKSKPINDNDSIAVSRQRSAIKQLSELQSLVSQISLAASSEADPEKIRQLSRLLNSAKAKLADYRIEVNLATMSEKQLRAYDAWAGGDYKFIACSGSNRCLAEGTLVATPSGPKPIESLRPGDTVYGPDAKPIRVLEVFGNGIRPCKRLVNRKQTLAICTEGHVFVTRRRGRRPNGRHDPVMQKPVSRFSKLTSVRRVEVEAPLGHVFEPHAYAIGAMLGDGCKHSTVRSKRMLISSENSIIPDRVAACVGGEAKKQSGNNYTYALDSDGMNYYDEWMRGLKAHEKRCDLDVVKTWDRQSLLALVAGLLDTDGSVHKRRDCDSLCVRWEMQCREAIETIVYAAMALWQVDLSVYVSDREKYVNGPTYAIGTSSPHHANRMLRELSPFIATPRKKWRAEYETHGSSRYNPDWLGVRVEEHGYEATYDIHVDHPENLYLLANGVVTHNSGKSFIAGTLYAEYLRDQAPPDSLHLCVTTNQKLSPRHQQKMLWDNIPHRMFDTKWAGMKNGFGSRSPLVVIDERTPENPDGRNVQVIFATQSEYEQDMNSFEGLSCETVWIDETVSEELLGACTARVANSDDGRILVSSIPNAEWYWSRVHNAAPEDRVWFELFEWFDNPSMDQQKWDHFCRGIPPHERDVRLKGVPAMAGSLVYVEFRDDIHVVEPADIPSDLVHYAGLDVGMDHPTVWLMVGVDKDGRYWVTQEYVSRNTPVEDDARAIQAILGDRKLNHPSYIDPAAFQVTKANQVSVAQQYQMHGLPTMRSRMTSQVGEMAQVHEIKELLAHEELFVSTNCPQLIREFHLWKYKRDRQNKALSKDGFEDKNNDALDALRYCLTMRPMYTRGTQKVTVLDV